MLEPISAGIRGIREAENLSPLAKILLVSIYEKPFLGIVKRYELLGLTTESGHKGQNELIFLDYVKPVTLEFGIMFDQGSAPDRANALSEAGGWPVLMDGGHVNPLIWGYKEDEIYESNIHARFSADYEIICCHISGTYLTTK